MSSWSSVGYSNLGDSWAFESCPFQGLSGLLLFKKGMYMYIYNHTYVYMLVHMCNGNVMGLSFQPDGSGKVSMLPSPAVFSLSFFT